MMYLCLFMAAVVCCFNESRFDSVKTKYELKMDKSKVNLYGLRKWNRKVTW